MVTPLALILRTAGTNCDGETQVACERVGFRTERIHVNALRHSSKKLHESCLLILPGGFTYGDDLGAGRILANEIKTSLWESLQSFVAEGKLILGICNGFQVLVKAGLLPDPRCKSSPSVTLTFNDNGRFEDRWVRLKISSRISEFLKEEEIIELPVAHGEGKFVPRDQEIYDELERRQQIVLRYVGPDGSGGAGFPWNPNGSVGDVAGICDPSGRVLGLMPHPERFQDSLNHPQWTRRKNVPPDGMKFFRNAFEYARTKL